MLRWLPGISSLLISTLPVHSSAFFQNLSWNFPLSAVASTGSCVGPQNKIGHLAGCRFPSWVPRNINRLIKHMRCGVMICEMNNLEIDWSLCSALNDVILCGWLGSKHQLTNKKFAAKHDLMAHDHMLDCLVKRLDYSVVIKVMVTERFKILVNVHLDDTSSAA